MSKDQSQLKQPQQPQSDQLPQEILVLNCKDGVILEDGKISTINILPHIHMKASFTKIGANATLNIIGSGYSPGKLILKAGATLDINGTKIVNNTDEEQIIDFTDNGSLQENCQPDNKLDLYNNHDNDDNDNGGNGKLAGDTEDVFDVS